MTAVLGMAALRQPLGIEVGLAAELGNPFRDPIRMLLLLARMLEKLGPRRLRVEPFGEVEMRLVAQTQTISVASTSFSTLMTCARSAR
jgi:hypothetical protein